MILVRAERVSDSCGYAVPLFEHRGDRTKLIEWAGAKSSAELDQYRADKNARSIDGLPAVDGRVAAAD